MAAPAQSRGAIRTTAAPWVLAIPAPVCRTQDLLLRRRRLGLLLFRQGLGLALGFGFIGRLVVGRAGTLGDFAHHLPGLLVGDREEAVVAVEFLLHRWREAE